jgi:hypothetical protein
MMANRTNESVKLRLKTLRIGDCEICGKDSQALQFAHIAPTPLNGQGRGRKERLYDFLNNRNCYALVCSKECNDIAEDLGKKGLKQFKRFMKRKRLIAAYEKGIALRAVMVEKLDKILGKVKKLREAN